MPPSVAFEYRWAEGRNELASRPSGRSGPATGRAVLAAVRGNNSALAAKRATASPIPIVFTSRLSGREAAQQLKQSAQTQDPALAKAPVRVLGEGRVVRRLALKPKPAKPAIGRVRCNPLAKPTLRASAQSVADDQHPDHQLRGATDGRPVEL